MRSDGLAAETNKLSPPRAISGAVAETDYALGEPAAERLLTDRAGASLLARVRAITWFGPVTVTWATTRVVILALAGAPPGSSGGMRSTTRSPRCSGVRVPSR